MRGYNEYTRPLKQGKSRKMFFAIQSGYRSGNDAVSHSCFNKRTSRTKITLPIGLVTGESNSRGENCTCVDLTMGTEFIHSIER